MAVKRLNNSEYPKADLPGVYQYLENYALKPEICGKSMDLRQTGNETKALVSIMVKPLLYFVTEWYFEWS